jgi:lipopolysaccharide/colanic/teichoic acid biosynthesis glycosyltransferase
MLLNSHSCAQELERLAGIDHEPLGIIAPARGPRRWYALAKVAGEWVAALVLLLLCSPVMLLAGLLVKVTSRGPVFYCQTRVGQLGRPYTILKIRTMYHRCEQVSGPRWAVPNDPRVTPVGRLMRAIHVDELPQLWNVLRGEMSLVGPRPERPEFVSHLEQALPDYQQRLAVRPGITGLAQVQLPADTDLESVRRKLAYDLYYIREMSAWMDIRILASTAFHLIGVPFPLLQRLFRMPSREVVERSTPVPAVNGRKVKPVPLAS